MGMAFNQVIRFCATHCYLKIGVPVNNTVWLAGINANHLLKTALLNYLPVKVNGP